MIKTNRQNEDGELITTNELIEYIMKNIAKMGTIGITNLNDNNVDVKKELSKISFQDIQPIGTMPIIFEQLFDSSVFKYVHAGVLDKINDVNVSLFSSIITCIKQSFLSQNVKYQQICITEFIDCLKKESIKKNYRKYGWEKNDIYIGLNRGFLGSNILKFINDYLCINIFVLDMESEKIMFCGGDEFIPYKGSIFLIRYKNNNFEPFYMENGKKIFYHNDLIMKKIQENKNLINLYRLCDDMNMEFKEHVENLDQYLHRDNQDKITKREEFMQEKIQKANTKEQETIAFIKKIKDGIEIESTPEKYDSKELKQKKLVELQEISKKLNIDIKTGNKNKTKDKLIDEILAM